MLYLSHDAANSTQEQIITVDPNTGSVRVEFTRYCPNYDNEAEDVCVYPMEDGSLFHVVDYDKLINANVSHYKPAELNFRSYFYSNIKEEVEFMATLLKNCRIYDGTGSDA